jgi:alpha-N-arabinofuranosidase
LLKVIEMRWSIAILAAHCIACGFADARADEITGPVTVKVRAEVLHGIDSRLFGQFMERPSWGGEIGAEAAILPGTHKLRPEAERLIREMRIPVARFPGGTDVDYVDWQDMVDNIPGRSPQRPVTVGHTGNEVTNGFGYDEFLRLAEELGMESIVVLNFRDGLLGERGPKEGARHAARLAAYCNAPLDAQLTEELAAWPRLRARNGHPAPYGVKYFQIGNETWAFLKEADREKYITTLERYIDEIRAVDPGAGIIVDGQPADLAAELHARLGDRIDYFAVHHYQPWRIAQVLRRGKPVAIADLTEEDAWYAWVTLPAIDEGGQSVLARGELEQARRLGYPVAMTEWNWNGWWGLPPGAEPPLNSLFAKGLGAAAILHAIIRQGDVVKIANQSMLIGDGWGIHAIYCDRHGATPPYMIPSGQVTKLYSLHHGDRRLAIEVAGMPFYEQPYQMAGIGPAAKAAYLDLLVTRDDKTVYLHAVNRHFREALPVRLDLTDLGGTPGSGGSLHVIEGRLQNAPAAGEAPAPATVRSEALKASGNSVEVVLPARCVAVAEIPLR